MTSLASPVKLHVASFVNLTYSFLTHSNLLGPQPLLGFTTGHIALFPSKHSYLPCLFATSLACSLIAVLQAINHVPARARQTLANPSIEATCNSVAFPTQQGWPEDCNTWEPAKNILAPLLLREWDASGGIQDSQKQGHMDNAGMFIAFAHTKIVRYPTHCFCI